MDFELPDLKILRRCWPDYEDPATTRTVNVNGQEFGGQRPVVIAGPCAVESYEQTLEIAQAVKEAGATLLRGGAFKPRTSPHDFQGLGVEGLEILAAVRRETGLGFVTEAMDPRMVETVAEVADMIQVGSRSLHNVPLLTEVGMTRMPVMLKRGWSATLAEWLCAAEYIAHEGNREIVFCERGIRSSCHWSYARNVLDLNVIEPLRRSTPLPVIVDPSHATGQWKLVAAMSHAAIAAGAHGLLIEAVGPMTEREMLKCDAEQGIPPHVLEEITAAACMAEITPVGHLDRSTSPAGCD